jgi:hypothetical protein
MVEDLKRKIAQEQGSMVNAPPEVSVKPALVSLLGLSAASPSPGLKAEKNRLVTPCTPRPGPKPDKNQPATRSTPSPGATELLMHSGRNLDMHYSEWTHSLRLFSIGD